MKAAASNAPAPKAEGAPAEPSKAIPAPWPDAKAREEMSEARASRQNAGKHSKNPDWEKKW